MAMDSKISFMNQLEKDLEKGLTVEHIGMVMKSVSELLDRFDMHEIAGSDSRADDLLDCYLSALQVEGRSRKTIDRYAYILGRLKNECGVPVRRITVYHLREWIAREKNRGIADSTLENCRQIFSAFFGWLHRESLIDRNPVANLGAIKCQKKKNKIFTDVDMEKLNAKCENMRYSLRNRAIVEFLKATGCRISEMTGLDRGQVDFQRLEAVVLGKGNKERLVYLNEVTAMILKEYLDSRKDDNPALFVGIRGERLQPNGVRIMLNNLADAAGVEHVHPHKFRRTLATNLNRRGMQVQEVAAILGHERLDTTMKYVVLNNEDIRNSYRRYA